MRNDCSIDGYARVSTDAQDFTNQLAQLKGAGCGVFFREKISGATADRPKLKKLLAALAHGDTALVLTGVLLYIIYVAKAQGRTPHLHYAAIGLDQPDRLFTDMAHSPHPYVEYVATGTGRIELRLRNG